MAFACTIFYEVNKKCYNHNRGSLVTFFNQVTKNVTRMDGQFWVFPDYFDPFLTAFMLKKSKPREISICVCLNKKHNLNLRQVCKI